MPAKQLVRVVALRKGKLKSVEFRIREGERGLSLFEYQSSSRLHEVVEAVRSLGKQGDLAAAVLQTADIRSLGLVLVHTLGGTSSRQINELHVEARLPLWRKLWLFLRGIRAYDYFNDTSAQLGARWLK